MQKRDTGELAGKVAWVTGASSGIGLATTITLADAGAAVVLSGRRRGPLESAAAAITAKDSDAFVVPLDVSDPKSVGDAAGLILERHNRIDILVNSAGINIQNRWWENFDAAGWQSVIATNLNGIAYSVAAVLPTMRRQRDGLIINISSWAGRYNSAIAGVAYVASKSGVLELSATINREELKHNIRCCCICPGEIATPILESRAVKPSAEEIARMLKPEDVAELIGFVARAPARVCFNELVLSPTHNRALL